MTVAALSDVQLPPAYAQVGRHLEQACDAIAAAAILAMANHPEELHSLAEAIAYADSLATELRLRHSAVYTKPSTPSPPVAP